MCICKRVMGQAGEGAGRGGRERARCVMQQLQGAQEHAEPSHCSLVGLRRPLIVAPSLQDALLQLRILLSKAQCSRRRGATHRSVQQL